MGNMIGKGTFSKVYNISIANQPKGMWVLKEHQPNSKETYIMAEKAVFHKLSTINHPNCIKMFPIRSRKFEIIEKCE